MKPLEAATALKHLHVPSAETEICVYILIYPPNATGPMYYASYLLCWTHPLRLPTLSLWIPPPIIFTYAILTLQAPHSSSNTAAYWLDAVGPTLKTSADRAKTASSAAWSVRMGPS